MPNHRCSQAGLCCLMHAALLITLVNFMKSLPCHGAEGRWSRRERALSPRPAQGRCGRAELPPAQPSLLIQCRLERGRALVPRGSQAAGAMRGPLLWAGWLLAAGCLLGATGSCRHRCCPGRNNACWAPGARRARCYCDSYCQRTGDCCQDYPTSCRRAAVGCAVGPWGPWSGCSSPCGAGSRARSRQVTVPPRHGGDPCPDLKQRRGCLGQHPTCGTAQAALVPEVAKILPNSFSQDFRDPWRRAGMPPPEEPSGYVWGRGPSVTPVPKAETPPAPPVLMASLHPQPLLFSLPQSTGRLHPHTKPWPSARPTEPPSFPPSKPGSLCTPQSHDPSHLPSRAPSATPKPTSSLYPNPSTTHPNLCPTSRPPFSLFPPPQLLRLFPPDPGGAPVPRARLEPPAAAGQAGLCGMPGESAPPPSPVHRTRPAGSQDILGGRFCGGVPGLMGAGGPAGGLCLLPPSSHLCVGKVCCSPLVPAPSVFH
ncbi:SCO-spondin-like isoform X1 [Zonotrichia leucophrys gambelii]|uniref:SCO-spondin-like isoform X1 n=1 Tax=Zonotrichia leucophrys gambelii TaxID=257770 RepID=UPI003140B9CB